MLKVRWTGMQWGIALCLWQLLTISAGAQTRHLHTSQIEDQLRLILSDEDSRILYEQWQTGDAKLATKSFKSSDQALWITCHQWQEGSRLLRHLCLFDFFVRKSRKAQATLQQIGLKRERLESRVICKEDIPKYLQIFGIKKADDPCVDFRSSDDRISFRCVKSEYDFESSYIFVSLEGLR